MPPKKARNTSPAVERRERLTLAKLASYDDVATDALVDHVCPSSALRHRVPSVDCLDF